MHFSHLSIIFFFCFLLNESTGQIKVDSTERKWILNGYIENFFVLNRNAAKESNISEFQYNHNRNNIPAINHAYMGVDHESRLFRMSLNAQIGTYVKDNYSSEPKLIRNLYTAYTGFAINKEKSSWIDIGIFPSYIGFESISAFDNLTLTRSLLAENSPYYLSGIRSNHKIGANNEIYVYALTGWQKIKPTQGNSLPSFGFQWIKKVKNNNKINNSFFAGSNYPDNNRKWRYFNNFFWQHNIGKWSWIIGLDIGLEQKFKNSKTFNTWWSPVLITSYNFNDKFKAAGRIEHYNDKSKVIVKTSNGNPLIGSGYSINIDYSPSSNMMYKAEWRQLFAGSDVFFGENSFSKKAEYLTISFSYRLSKNLF